MPCFTLNGGEDAGVNGGDGFLLLGSEDGLNIAIDNNEIMARNGDNTASLYLQADGGETIINGTGNGKVFIGTKDPGPAFDIALIANRGIAIESGDSGIGFGVRGSYNTNITARGLYTDTLGIGRDPSPATFRLLLDENSAGKPGGGSWADSSDRRLKKDIKNLTGALDKIMQLQGVTYKWRNPDEHVSGTRAGVIAQDMEEVFQTPKTNKIEKIPIESRT
jgi:hypothetical protein